MLSQGKGMSEDSLVSHADLNMYDVYISTLCNRPRLLRNALHRIRSVQQMRYEHPGDIQLAVFYEFMN